MASRDDDSQSDVFMLSLYDCMNAWLYRGSWECLGFVGPATQGLPGASKLLIGSLNGGGGIVHTALQTQSWVC